MKLILLETRNVKHWDKRKIRRDEFHILEPSQFDIEKAQAYCHLNGLDRIVIYTSEVI